MTRWKKLGVIAGGGELPLLLAEHLTRIGQPFWFARITPFADARLSSYPGADYNLGQMGARIDGLRNAGCDAVVMFGMVARPNFAELQFDAHGLSMLPKLAAAAPKGDDALLRVLVEELEAAGFAVIGLHEAFEELLAPAGALGAHTPSERNLKDAAKAARIADALNVWDVGQGLVVCDGLVLAVEAQEGTDQMLARVAGLPQNIRGGADARRGVLLKRPKPNQERRMDMPTIGVRTIENCAAAGLAGVAIEASGALIVKREETLARANALGLFVYGFTPEEFAAP
ncbi:MAG: LpxI family protein [Hyphomonadaceae bacterium]